MTPEHTIFYDLQVGELEKLNTERFINIDWRDLGTERDKLIGHAFRLYDYKNQAFEYEITTAGIQSARPNVEQLTGFESRVNPHEEGELEIMIPQVGEGIMYVSPNANFKNPKVRSEKLVGKLTMDECINAKYTIAFMPNPADKNNDNIIVQARLASGKTVSWEYAKNEMVVTRKGEHHSTTLISDPENPCTYLVLKAKPKQLDDVPFLERQLQEVKKLDLSVERRVREMQQDFDAIKQLPLTERGNVARNVVRLLALTAPENAQESLMQYAENEIQRRIGKPLSPKKEDELWTKIRVIKETNLSSVFSMIYQALDYFFDKDSPLMRKSLEENQSLSSLPGYIDQFLQNKEVTAEVIQKLCQNQTSNDYELLWSASTVIAGALGEYWPTHLGAENTMTAAATLMAALRVENSYFFSHADQIEKRKASSQKLSATIAVLQQIVAEGQHNYIGNMLNTIIELYDLLEKRGGKPPHAAINFERT